MYSTLINQMAISSVMCVWFWLIDNVLCIQIHTDENGGHYRAIDIALQCHYLMGETDRFVVFSVPYYGCLFVERV